VLKEDGWPWSAKELTESFWLLVKMPGVPASDYQQYTGPPDPPEPLPGNLTTSMPLLAGDPAQPIPYFFRRWYVDLDALAAVLSPAPMTTPVLLDTPSSRAAFDASIKERLLP
jgi:hypothetical protein